MLESLSSLNVVVAKVDSAMISPSLSTRAARAEPVPLEEEEGEVSSWSTPRQ